MQVKTIKGIEEETWAEFRSICTKNRLSTGQCFEKLIGFYKQNAKDFWDDILSGKKNLSSEEAQDIRVMTQKVRKERGFRL